MQVINKSQSRRIKSLSTTIHEYFLDVDDLSGAVADINNRYPDNGYAINHKCKEIVYIISGKGKIVTSDSVTTFSSGDVVFINKKEKFYWKGKFTMFMVTSPKFDPKQHQIVS